MHIELTFIIRLVVAGILGAAIGLERELRAKEAGVRTHFMVAIGSCLMMIVSQWGFAEILTWSGGPGNVEMRLDPARIAAQVVSGIGFLGAGTIMMNKQFVRGLTTAAGLWAMAGIGLAVGSGMYILAVTATLLCLFCLETLQFFVRRVKMRSVRVVFLTSDPESLILITDELHKSDLALISYSASSTPDAQGRTKVTISVREHYTNEKESEVVSFLARFPGITVEKIDS